MQPMTSPARLFRNLIVLCLLSCSVAATSASADESVVVCDIYGDHARAVSMAVPGIGTSRRCPGNAAPHSYTRTRHPGGMAIWTMPNQTVAQGRSARWKIVAPPGLRIASVYVPHMYSYGINDGTGWGGGFYWSGGSGGLHTDDGERGWSSASRESPPFRWPSGGTRTFGWQIACRARRCSGGGKQWVSVELLELRVRETRRPRLMAPDGIWPSRGWVRGVWRLHFSGISPSGMCGVAASFDHALIAASHSQPNRARWRQCAAPAIDHLLNTADYGDGVFPLRISGRDAAGISTTDRREVEVDNEVPTVLLSGPRSASGAAGTQFVRAIAQAGPSGVAGISCAVDRSSAHWYAEAIARVPVHGVGVHHIRCYSQNNARDAAGQTATSHPAEWTLSIRSPSVSTITFARAGRARRWFRRGRSRGSRRAVPGPGKVRWLRVRFGMRAAVAGWLRTASGKGLGGQLIRVMAEPDDGSFRFRQIAEVRTARDGLWRARLPVGPSRTVIAEYDGAPTIEPASSSPLHLSVSAGVRLHIHPQATHWGSTIRIRGKVRGGHIPSPGELVVLRVRWAGGSAVIGNLFTGQTGRFSSKFTFRRGAGTRRYRIWATTVRESAYPYAPGRSKPIRVTVTP